MLSQLIISNLVKNLKLGNYILDNTYIKNQIDEQRELNLDRKFTLSDKEKVIVSWKFSWN